MKINSPRFRSHFSICLLTLTLFILNICPTSANPINPSLPAATSNNQTPWILGTWSPSIEECSYVKYQFLSKELNILDDIEGSTYKEKTPITKYDYKDKLVYVHLGSKHTYAGWVFKDNTMRFRQISQNEIAIQLSLAGGEVSLVRCDQNQKKK